MTNSVFVGYRALSTVAIHSTHPTEEDEEKPEHSNYSRNDSFPARINLFLPVSLHHHHPSRVICTEIKYRSLLFGEKKAKGLDKVTCRGRYTTMTICPHVTSSPETMSGRYPNSIRMKFNNPLGYIPTHPSPCLKYDSILHIS